MPNFWLFSNQNRQLKNYLQILVFRTTIERKDPELYAPRLHIIYYNGMLFDMDGFHFFWSQLVLNMHFLFYFGFTDGRCWGNILLDHKITKPPIVLPKTVSTYKENVFSPIILGFFFLTQLLPTHLAAHSCTRLFSCWPSCYF